MASANMKLRKQMETADASKFDIENVEHCPDKIIEMNVSLFEMDGESGAEDQLDDSQSDTESYGEVTAENLKLPTIHPQRKGRIEVVSVDSSSESD
ncbi:NOP protein chaperone 1 [Rhinoraja longicauda]